MDKQHYIISDAAKELHVEAHVLRYWEEELNLYIPRNKMGHRLYGEKEMNLLRQIIQWKEEGLTLKEIHDRCNPSDQTSETTSPPAVHGQVIPYPADRNMIRVPDAPAEGQATVTPVKEDDKMQQFKQILGRIVSDAIRDNSQELTSDIAGHVSEHVNKELDFLFREKEEADEKRYRQLDETIRNFQKARYEAAAAEINESKSRRKRRRAKKNPV